MRYRIERDLEPPAPNEWCDNERLFLWADHCQFSVGEKPDSTEGFEVFPLYAYIHSGVALSLGNSEYPFSDRWDSGQVGFVYVSKDPGEFGERPLDRVAQSLVDEWNTYLCGDVWGYVIEDEDGEHVHSCWGFYGEKFCETEAKQALKFEEQYRVAEIAKIDLVWAY